MGCNSSDLSDNQKKGGGPKRHVGDNKVKKVNYADTTQKAEVSEAPRTRQPEGSTGDGMLGISQSQEIEKLLAKLEAGELFCDPDFPADKAAITYYDEDVSDILWLRPKDIVPDGQNPYLLVDGVNKNDIKQGNLGDCWFLSSCAAVSQQEKCMKKIIPGNQPLFGTGYKGVVHFTFWRFGSWVDVYVDDRLPTRNGSLIYARCTDPTEFWVALLEKAYAKIHGSYRALEGGQSMDALVDLTGGLAERCVLTSAESLLYRRLLRAYRSELAFIACSRKGNWRGTNAEADSSGLLDGHAYSITGVRKINHDHGQARLLRVRNPWGDSTEWKGAWSDNDDRWDWVDSETKKLMEVALRPDGEFWMSFEDFCDEFHEITICTLQPDFDGDGISDEAGGVQTVHGQWAIGRTAGGSRNNLHMFVTNQQFAISLQKPDDFDPLMDDPDSEGKCSVVISLMQEHRRSQRHLGTKTLQIGFFVYETFDPEEPLPFKHFMYNREAGKSGTFINLREVISRLELAPGHYVIIPCTFQPNEEAEFLLRVYAEKEFKISEPMNSDDMGLHMRAAGFL